MIEVQNRSHLDTDEVRSGIDQVVTHKMKTRALNADAKPQLLSL